MKSITFHQCQSPEESWISAMVAEHAAETANRESDLDVQDRMQAEFCERCREPVDSMLTIEGGDAVCDECLEASLEKETV